ncbi:MAG: DNRLRE domain-containing protein [Clostridia bacterium]|nr:DNRLRE domain-containing protein [Clostridia bacterium]
MAKILSIFLAVTLLLPLFALLPIKASAYSYDDSAFFSRFDYTSHTGLSAVKSYVDAGDYTSAKRALLDYYIARKASGQTPAFEITQKDANIGMANLALDNIITGPYEFDVQIGMFTVSGVGSGSAQWYETDITQKVVSERDNANISIMLFARQKQRYPVIVLSRESSFYPTLVIEMDNGAQYRIAADKDTYIHSGNQSTSYATETELYIKEDAANGADSSGAFGNASRRAYINFPLSSIPEGRIKSATLNLYAYLAEDCTTGAKDVHVISVGDSTWNDASLTWGGINGSIYSWQGEAAGPTWVKPSGSDGEYLNVACRFWYARAMAWEYKKYLADPSGYPEGEAYGPQLLFLMNSFATACSAGFNRTLETGERLNRWTDVLYAMLDTPAMTPDIFCNLVNYMWGDCNSLATKDISNGSYWWSNWRVVANAGFAKAAEFFPEFTTYTAWHAKAKSNLEWTLDNLYNDDYSFKEAGPAYAIWCAELYSDAAIMCYNCGNPYDTIFNEKLRHATYYAMDMCYPDGYDTNIGDSNYKDQSHVFLRIGEYLNDDMLRCFTSSSAEGTALYNSRYYSDAHWATMRSGWDKENDVYINFHTNNADGHAHPDSAQMLLYAYGSPLLVDSGRYGYSGSSLFTLLRYSQAHNTVEVSGLSMGDHSQSGQDFSYWQSNGSFDFAQSAQHGYSNIIHTRSILFIKDGFAIVSDDINNTSSSSYTYLQNWHFMPSSNAAANGNNVSTAFADRANITISSPSANASVKDGYHSADYGLAAASKYASFSQNAVSAKFDTILYPTRANENVNIASQELSSDLDYSAVKFTIDGNESYFYNAHDSISERAFGAYTYDGKCAYAAADMYIAIGGSNLTHNGVALIECPYSVSDISARINGEALALDGSMLIPSTDESSGIRIYAPNAVSVTLNGIDVPFVRDGDYVIAAAEMEYDFVIDGVVYNKVSGENLVPNPSFETDTSSWGTWNGSAITSLGTFSRTNEQSHDGIYSILSNANGSGTSASNIVGQFPLNNSGSSKQYILSFWRYSGIDSITLTVGLASANGVTVDLACGGLGNLGTDTPSCNLTGLPQNQWHQMQYLLTSSPESTNAIFYARWLGTSTYFDDFELYEVAAVQDATSLHIRHVDENGTEIADTNVLYPTSTGTYIYEDAPGYIVFNGNAYTLNSDNTFSLLIQNGSNDLVLEYTKSDVSLAPTADKTVNMGSGLLEESSTVRATGSNAASRRNGYVKFTLPALDAANIVSASLYLKAQGGNNGNTIVHLYEADSEWSETDAAVPDKGPQIATCSISLAEANAHKSLAFDVTDYIKDSSSGGDVSFVLAADTDGSTTGNLVSFYSRENTDTLASPPMLCIEYLMTFDGETASVDYNSGNVYIAHYNLDGILLSADVHDSKDGLSFSLAAPEGTQKSAAFLWATPMRPLIKPITKQN